MFSNGHATVTSCLFLQYYQSGWWEKCLCIFWNADYFALFTFHIQMAAYEADLECSNE